MPFVDQAHRDAPDMEIAGDRAYLEYKYMIERWTAAPRWTTVDQLAQRLYPDGHERAFFLSFLVFFDKIVIPYEQKKCTENGDIL